MRRLAILLTILVLTHLCNAQQPTAPNELRGYKVERSAVQIQGKDSSDRLIQLGNARLARVTPLGISLETPIVVARVQQKGHVDFLMFEDMVVNGTAVDIDEYHRGFNLPNKKELVLKEPLKFYIYLPQAILAALGEWTSSKENWRVTGRVYVFGRYKKFLFTFKRTIPVDIDLMIKNPLR